MSQAVSKRLTRMTRKSSWFPTLLPDIYKVLHCRGYEIGTFFLGGDGKDLIQTFCGDFLRDFPKIMVHVWDVSWWIITRCWVKQMNVWFTMQCFEPMYRWMFDVLKHSQKCKPSLAFFTQRIRYSKSSCRVETKCLLQVYCFNPRHFPGVQLNCNLSPTTSRT